MLEADILEEAGILPSAAAFVKKVRLYNTSHYYKQQKFNLVAEESEGYSKYLAVLSSCLNEPEDNDGVRQVVAKIRSLMGGFHLDPNRCLDMLLFALAETFAPTSSSSNSTQDSKRQRLLTLLKERFLPTNKIPPLLNFQLQSHSNNTYVLECIALLVEHR